MIDAAFHIDPEPVADAIDRQVERIAILHQLASKQMFNGLLIAQQRHAVAHVMNRISRQQRRHRLADTIGSRRG